MFYETLNHGFVINYVAAFCFHNIKPTMKLEEKIEIYESDVTVICLMYKHHFPGFKAASSNNLKDKLEQSECSRKNYEKKNRSKSGVHLWINE